jgi:CheY-like chemotaxis protein
VKKSINKILIIEDQKEARLELTNFFKENGYTVFPAKHALEAVKILKTKVPDLIITEISMPKMDGFTFVEYFRKLPNTAFIPIIFLSAKIDSTILKKIICYNVDNYLKKPFVLTELNRIVKELLKENKSIKKNKSPLPNITCSLNA